MYISENCLSFRKIFFVSSDVKDISKSADKHTKLAAMQDSTV